MVVEAQLSGTPIVATALGGALDLIKDNQDGVLVPAVDPTAMTAAWERAFNDEVGRSRWIRNGLDGFQTFSPEAHCDQVEALYAGLMNRDGDRDSPERSQRRGRPTTPTRRTMRSISS